MDKKLTTAPNRDADMDRIQDEIHEWAEATFEHDALSIAAHLLSEAGELYKACGGNAYDASLIAYNAKHKNAGNIADNTADVLILALCMAGFQNFKARKAIVIKMAINRVSKWPVKGAPKNKHGFLEHIEEG